MQTYLALGDSYTIGEKVPYAQNFPNQTAFFLKEQGIQFQLSDLIATTGWTTDELFAAIHEKKLKHTYNWVSLLIGVNNQYRGRSTKEYAWQFEALLCKAILCAQANTSRVVVLSIPDWGLTPFNTDRNAHTVSEEIDEYNAINKSISLQYGCHYIDVTTSTRNHAKDASYLAEDKLHYSAREYEIWAQKLSTLIRDNQ